MSNTPTTLCVPPNVIQEIKADGTQYLGSGIAFDGQYARCVGDWLVHWAAQTPDNVFLAQRDVQGAWQTLSYQAVLTRVQQIATWMLRQQLSAERPVIALSDNGIEHALLMLAAMHIGVPFSPISPAYSLLAQDHARLKANVELLRPGLVFADQAERFAPALSAIASLHDGVVVAGSRSSSLPAGAISFDELSVSADEQAVASANATVTGDTIAKFLFTSGSTGLPKAVINTQRMLCSNQYAKQQIWPMLAQEKPVLVDWLPWSHTFGGNHNFNIVLANGGSLYIDEGKPAPGLLDKTLDNLREISPTMYFSVPRAYDFLVPALHSDKALREQFFKRLRFIFYAGAALPQHLWDGLQKIIDDTPGCNTMLVSSWGSTETAPIATDCHFQASISGNIGVPVPGTQLKLVPNAGKLEVRVKGPNVTPGYWKNTAETEKAFDEEGYYLIGDAMKFVDAEKPEAGLLFDGRTSEDFKLLTGTWVHVGAIRLKGIEALKPLAQDIVVTGHDRDNIGFLIVPNLPGCRSVCRQSPLPDDATAEEIVKHPEVLAHLQHSLQALKSAGGGSSSYARSALIMADPLSTGNGELTDKGYINQRAVLNNRAELVEALYADAPAEGVVQL